MELRPGELLVVAGPTGSGKSLLLRALSSLDPLDEGIVRLEGSPAEEWPVTRYRHTAVYLHQSPALFPGDVDDNLREAFEWEEHHVLLLDEPTAALDPGATGAVERLVRSWIGGRRSALWVTHDRGQARRIGDRGLLLDDGCLRPLAEGG